MLLVFEVVFYCSNITDCIYRGWAGRRTGLEVGSRGWGKRSGMNGSVVPSVGDPGWHNSQERPGLPLVSVWHPMQSY